MKSSSAPNIDSASRGTVFDIQDFSLHDGPGIRTTIFFKGCPLRCAWCQNPESQQKHAELLVDTDKCDGCARCVFVCPHRAIAIRDGKAVTNRQLCEGAGDCTTVCPQNARQLIGRQTTAHTAFDEAAHDALFFERSGGGITLSGGEPLMQPLLAISILRRCKAFGFHTTLDTCGYAKWQTVASVLRYVDLVLYDFKHMDPAEHARLTGVSNRLILENVKRIQHELEVPMRARVPIVPGCNDSDDNLHATAAFIALELAPTIPVHLNPYHRLGVGKYARLERHDYAIDAEPPSAARMQYIKRLFETYGLQTEIGG